MVMGLFPHRATMPKATVCLAMITPETRRHSPAAERNSGPILAVLQRVLPPQGSALEIACGTGQHALHFASHLPRWTWLPTDPDPEAVASTACWAAEAGLPNLCEPRLLDVMTAHWPVRGLFDAVYCANLLHIAPWPACAALMQGAARLLAPGGALLVYGPFLIEGQPTAPGNLAFDADLRARDPAWGLRAVHDVAAQAAAAGLVLAEQVTMPANNLTLMFKAEPRHAHL
jgi:SAM-dependent methyltransferase